MKVGMTMAALAALATTMPAQAQASMPNQRQPLAMGVEVGMTKDEAKAIVPKGFPEITSGCRGEVKPVYKQGAVAFMRILDISGRSAAQCGDTIIANLKAKYGEPEAGDGANDCDFYAQGCALIGLGSVFKSPVARVVDQADATNGNRYLRFKASGVAIDVKLDVARNAVDVVYRPNVADAAVSAEAQARL